jgi:hypothetical protein
MKIKHGLFFGFAVMLIAVIFAFTGCSNPAGGSSSTSDITYTAKADGSATVSSSKIDFVFSADVTGLTAAQITISGSPGAADKGNLTGSGKNWSLSITTTTAGEAKVSIKKDGIESGAKSITLYKAGGGPSDKVVKPTASPAAGEVASGTEITLSTTTAGATIYYTTDDSTPSASSTEYDSDSKPVINADTTLKVIAVKTGMDDSEVLTAAYTITGPAKVAKPTASPAAGEVASGTEIILATTTPGATIYYTTDDSAPSVSSTEYDSDSKPVINANTTIKAIAVKDGMTNSDVLTVAYTVPAPTFTVTDVTITAENGAIPDENERIYMEKNDSLQLSATVTGTGDFAQTVTWSIITNGIALGTSISDDGLLTVARMETKTSLAVRATSTVDPTKSGLRSIYFTLRETNLKTRFEITSTGTQGVTATFNAVHAYLQSKTPAEVVSEGKIKVGDYIDLESLSIQGYPTNIEENGSVTIRANQDITPSSLPFPGYEGKLLRLIGVGINSFNANGAFTGNDNGSDAHIVFQFQNIPVKRTMEATLTNANGYFGSQMRTYLLNRFYVGLREAGVPMNEIVWAPKRYVANKGGGEGTTPELIEDKIWLPTEWEMAGTGEYSDPVCETEENQARLEYYTNNSEEDNSKSRAKYNASSIRTNYWLATPSKSNTDAFCEIYYYPTSGNSPNAATGANSMGGVAPAFCVK